MLFMLQVMRKSRIFPNDATYRRSMVQNFLPKLKKKGDFEKEMKMIDKQTLCPLEQAFIYLIQLRVQCDIGAN